jgi:hypothetical protein
MNDSHEVRIILVHLLRDVFANREIEGSFKRRSVNQPGMQNDAGADFGERNAEHQGDEVFVHGDSPWRLSSAILLSPSLQSANPRECELPHA